MKFKETGSDKFVAMHLPSGFADSDYDATEFLDEADFFKTIQSDDRYSMKWNYAQYQKIDFGHKRP